jgi:hypothetical protein
VDNRHAAGCGAPVFNRQRTLQAIAGAVLLLLVYFSSGCAALAPSALPALAGQAAYVGATVRLASHPQERARFERAHAGLTAALAAGNFEAESFAVIVRELPVLRDGPRALYAGLAVMLWNDLMGDASLIDKAPVVRRTMESVRDGLGRALGK